MLVALIPVTTSGFLIWTTTLTTAAVIGGALGVPAGAVTAGAGIVLGAVAGVGVAVFMKSKRRSLMRMAIIQKFDKEIAPKLREWAISHMHG